MANIKHLAPYLGDINENNIQFTVEDGNTQIRTDRGVVALLSTDANGNTALVGADGVPISVGSSVGTVLTVGATGDYATLDEALAARALISHTLLASGTGSITYTASEDDRQIILTAAIANETAGDLGVRLNGAGPIMRCNLVGSGATTTRINLRYPIDQTYSSVSVEVFKINQIGICILPGERIVLGDSTTRLIPAYTTIYCPTHRGASITHVATADGICFTSDGTENEIWFQNLIIGSAVGDLNSIMFSWGNTSPLTDIGYIDCFLSTQSQDLVYFGGGLRGGVHFIHNDIVGTFDAVCNPLLSRLLNVQGNTISMSSRGDCVAGSGDNGQPCGVPLGSTTYSGTYPSIKALIYENNIITYGIPAGSAEGVRAICVEIRHKLPSQAIVDVSGNYLESHRRGGTAGGTAGYAAAVSVAAFTPGAETPTIIVRNNVIKSLLSNSADGTAYSLHSPHTGYSIKRNGNRVISGTLGSNTDATGFI